MRNISLKGKEVNEEVIKEELLKALGEDQFIIKSKFMKTETGRLLLLAFIKSKYIDLTVKVLEVTYSPIFQDLSLKYIHIRKDEAEMLASLFDDEGCIKKDIKDCD